MAETEFARAILAVLADAPEPLGARYIRHALHEAGHELSEATVSRRLRDLDRRGLTVQAGAKGRVLTSAGRSHVATATRNRTTAAYFQQGTDVRTAQDLINLLRARRAIEPEAAREAAEFREPSGIAALEKLIKQHHEHYAAADNVPRTIALGFHREVARWSRNPIVKAMLDVVLHPALDRLEAALDVILVSHHVGAASIEEHQAIVDEISAGNADAAERAMRAHLDRLLGEVERFVTEETAPIVERLLTWAT
jgi:DNA-binding FadR family transcriptional regulator